ncbi:MAG: hypothetical protein NUV77_05575 [Thermoguttaceae bacterium]|nr:hypothetical protein [Thermoguttaceae bacterium]
MTRLSQLRRRLVRLRRRRRLARWVIAYSGLALVVLWVLAVLFAADWSLRMGKPERIVLSVLAAGVVVWACRRVTAPWLWQSEDDLDMALLIERQRHIDTDVIAALEFESPEAPRWGSVQLEQAVIDQTAQTIAQVEPQAEVPETPLKRRVGLLAATCRVLGVLAAVFPQHVAVFFNRLLLGAAHYPTATTIEAARINGHELDLAWGTTRVKCPYGQPVRFEVRCSGTLPVSGSARLKGEHGLAASVLLERTSDESALYRGELARLVDSADCLLYLGDAWTEPVRIELVPPPTVDVQLEVSPPGYAGSAPEVFKDLRQISVIENSRVGLRVFSDKELQEATLAIDGRSFALRRHGPKPPEGGTDEWVLPDELYEAPGTEKPQNPFPLAHVVEPVRYVLQVTDIDGLQLERPIEGVVRIKTDHPPQVTASIITHYVVPTARPTIRYAASDDYGLAKISLIPEILHADGREEEKPEITVFELRPGDAPPKSLPQRDEREAKFVLNLAPLGAVKGDQVKVTLRAIDFRGDPERGKSALSDPMVFQVTDEQGVLAAMAEQERESLRQVDTMIQTQISVGESK